MAYQVLARRWRSRKFEEVVGQNHITTALRNAIVRDDIKHAYLFSGTRGIGKTTIARIFAKALCCENRASDGNPCLVCGSCKSVDSGTNFNVLEIDGASNNGVEQVRQLIENVNYLPTQGSYKVYIVDEVHMLTVSAFNALLKTLEEPPEHVLFIFATTEPEKLLDTVLSRCQRFNFKNASLNDLINHVKAVAKSEQISIVDDSLIRQLAYQAKGSFRDVLTLLDQVIICSDGKQISEETMNFSLGLVGREPLKILLSALLNGDVTACSNMFNSIVQENVEIKNLVFGILDNLFEVIQNIDTPNRIYSREILVNNTLEGFDVAELFWIYENLSKDLQWSLSSLDVERTTLLVLQKICYRRKFFSSNSLVIKQNEECGPLDTVVPELGSSPIIEEAMPDAPLLDAPLPDAPLPDAPTPDAPMPDAPTPDAPMLDTPIEDSIARVDLSWHGFLQFMYEKYPARAANLEQGNILGTIEVDAKTLEVEIGFSPGSKVFYDYLIESEMQSKLVQNIAEYFGKTSAEVCLKLKYLEKTQDGFESTFDETKRKEDLAKQKRADELVNDPLIKQAETIFGGKVDKVMVKEQWRGSNEEHE